MMMVRTDEQIAMVEAGLRPGFRDAVTRGARRAGETAWEITSEQWFLTVRQFSESPKPATEPTLAELASNFSTALGKWIAAGVPVVSQSLYEARAAACAACHLWDAEARAGLGKCNAPGCGCTMFKRWLATERCPLGEWPR